MTKDGELAVIHGGFDGELPKINRGDDTKDIYIYDLTLAECRDYFKKTFVFKESKE